MIIFFLCFIASSFLSCADVILPQLNVWEELKTAIEIEDLDNFCFLILKNKKNINYQDKLGMSLLMYAAVKGNKKIVEKLIEVGAKVDLQNDFSLFRTALELAQHHGHTEIAEILKKENIIEYK